MANEFEMNSMNETTTPAVPSVPTDTEDIESIATMDASGTEEDTAAEESEKNQVSSQADTHRQNGREAIESSRQNLRNEIGTFFTGSVEASMPGAEKSRELDALRAAQRNGTVCRACVQAVYQPDEQGHVAIDALYGNSTWVRFVAQDFLADTPRFARIADDQDPVSRGTRWMQAARRYIGANISFVVMGIERDDKGQTIVYGSRSRARQIIQNSVFFGKNCNVSVGDFGKAEIVDSSPNRIWVEFCGIEVRMNNAALVAFQYLADCTKDSRFTVGQSLYVAVQSINVDKERRTVSNLSLSHAYIELMSTDIPDLPEDFLHSSRLGRIIAVRENSYVAVFNGIRCRAIIREQDNRTYEQLKIGDKVQVLITGLSSKNKHLAFGACYRF